MPLSSAAAVVRSPRLRVSVCGELLSGVCQAEVVSGSHYGADWFSLSAAMNADPWAGPAFWASQTNIFVDIQCSLDGGGSFEDLLQGRADSVSVDPMAGTVRLEGRDLTALLIEARIHEAFVNRTASEIATILADRHGLVPVAMPTSRLVGRYDEDGYNRLALDQYGKATTEWDLLVGLARQEQYEVFVQGTTLNFLPTIQEPEADCVIYPRSLIEYRLERALNLTGEIEVMVRSWNALQQCAYVEGVNSRLAAGDPDGAAGYSRQGLRYMLVHPNLTPDAALRLARQRADEVARHERVIDVVMPGELALTPRSHVQFAGTGTEFDQLYHVDSLERLFHPRRGFRQRMRLIGASPRRVTMAESDGR